MSPVEELTAVLGDALRDPQASAGDRKAVATLLHDFGDRVALPWTHHMLYGLVRYDLRERILLSTAGSINPQRTGDMRTGPYVEVVDRYKTTVAAALSVRRALELAEGYLGAEGFIVLSPTIRSLHGWRAYSPDERFLYPHHENGVDALAYPVARLIRHASGWTGHLWANEVTFKQTRDLLGSVGLVQRATRDEAQDAVTTILMEQHGWTRKSDDRAFRGHL